MDGSAPTEATWVVDDLTYAGLVWGPEDGTPVLALHGWMDHAGSFAELAPRLTGCRVVALDLSGQGLSGHRAAHATYNIWDDLPQIAGLLDQMGWDRCVLVGHSRGANIASLFAAAQPERVRGVIAIDSLTVEPADPENTVATLRAFVEETRARRTRPSRTFASRDDYVARRVAQGNSAVTSEALADRALERVEGGVQLRGDPRLFASSAMRLGRRDVENVLRAIACPVLNIWGDAGLLQKRTKAQEVVAAARTLIADYEVLEIAGDHHLHLVPETAERIATAALAFIARLE
ncbi:alpha/beta fold hydrolase [Maritimibacter sp. DP1N21-5]|uniref:alpha/beta fold hydrolase n=1 Tax=Maritimibacter sp. DP1N21-5 TaxID=2836867 RepID=UPI001C485EFB|nr:alpha/beta hydrolase [Maritimibacter sp. DP1N21-5]MBV7407382.1 alpha/beta hydrolase [Maritimibacter sp. DP1N21-5]